MKDTTPLANINFPAAAKPKVLTQITNVDQFKPKEDITGVCTSLEEWALRILKPNQTVQLQDLVDTDSETESRICEDSSTESLCCDSAFAHKKEFYIFKFPKRFSEIS